MKDTFLIATRAAAICALLAGGCVSACHQSVPQGASSAMEFLHSGSPQVCTSSEVQQTLQDMILPKPGDIPGDGSIVDKTSAISNVSLAYRETTLQSFDHTVNRATCNTTLHIATSDRSNDYDITFQVSPSADDPRLIIVAANLVDAKSYASGLIADAALKAATDRQAQADAAQQQQAKTALIARLNPRWLAGIWISATADSSNCADERALTLAPNRTFSSQGNSGRWALDADQLHFIGGGGPAGPVNDVSTITQADQESFTTVGKDAQPVTWRRCARTEIDPSVAPPAPPGGDTAPTQPQG